MKELYFPLLRRIATVIQDTGDEVAIHQLLRDIIPGMYADKILKPEYRLTSHAFQRKKENLLTQKSNA